MEFKNKAEEEKAAMVMEGRAQRSREALAICGHREARFNLQRTAEEQEAEAARIRAIIPTLPD